jgi:hypothetical protein
MANLQSRALAQHAVQLFLELVEARNFFKNLANAFL